MIRNSAQPSRRPSLRNSNRAALDLDLDLDLALAAKRAEVQATQIATSGGRAQGLRREVTGMDARQALGPRMGPAARSSREQARSEGTPERSVGDDGSGRFLVPFCHDKKGPAVRAER